MQKGNIHRGNEQLSLLLAEDLDTFFHQFVSLYQHRLYGFVLRQLGNGSDAEDITQEAFIRAYFAMKSYPNTRIQTLKLQPWLYKITLNVLYSHTHTSRLQLVSLDFSEEHSLLEREDQSPGPEEEVGWQEHRRELEDLVAKLPPRYRLAVNLRYFEDLSYQEISLLLSQPLGTVKSNVHRGLDLLRQMHIGACLDEVNNS